VRILLTSPFAHPYVRRGVERYVGELADWLARAGHEVTLLTTAPDRTRVEVRPSGAAVRYLRSGRNVGYRRWRTDEVWRPLPALTRGVGSTPRPDIVEAHHFPDAVALRAAGPLRRFPRYTLWLPGVARRSYFEDRPLYLAGFHAAVRGAEVLVSLSRYAADCLRRDFGLASEVLPPGVDTSLYSGPRPDTEAPVVFSAAAADDPRKRTEVLVRAFEVLAHRRPDVRLVLAPPRSEPAEALVRGVDPAVRARVEIRVPSGSEELAALYRAAAVSVLPSVDEAFGLVLVESLAAGAAVVAARHGALPEVIDDESIGCLAEPDDPYDLARAIDEALGLAADPATAPACRAAARRWDWDQIGPRWMELHTRVT
jgi:glycosyltransferase involved in cell wall biosynthesis